ncbi:MAG TPA: outer membrane beta-barrel protein [Chryseosolibacter sp.]
MKDMEREKFDESLRNAFEKAEINPSDKVWTNIELDLEKAKGGDLKRRLMFYQMLAAASVVFALAIGSVGYYYAFNINASSSNNFAAETGPSSDVFRSERDSGAKITETNPKDEQQPDARAPQATPLADAGNQNDLLTDSDYKKAPPDRRQVADNNTTPRKKPAGATTGTDGISTRDGVSDNDGDFTRLMASGSGYGSSADLPLAFDDGDLPPLYTPREVHLNFADEKEEVDPVVAMLAMLEQREKEVQDETENKERNSEGENLWTSIGFSAGSFNTMQASAPSASSGQSARTMALTAPIVDQETKANGHSYSMGVNVGKKISDRWVLQGGVNYLTHASEYTANNVVMESTGYQKQQFHAVSTNAIINANEQELANKIVYSAPYSVNNSMRYLSIPMQAGYLIVNKTFGIQVNAGVATDLFLQNTVKADQLTKISQASGSESPFRTVNLSGLFGTEFSYRFSENYRISLNPGIRYPFNTIYKSELGLQSTPITFDIGLRFRYIFH